MVTDPESNTYEGAAGVRSLADDTPMTTNDVFAIFSTTKAIGGTAVMQCVEEGLLDLTLRQGNTPRRSASCGCLTDSTRRKSETARAPN